MTRRRALRVALLSVAGLVVLGAAAAMLVIGPRNLIGMLRYDQRQEGSLKPGQPAPDARLVALDGRTPVPLLARAEGRPLVLVFGSFT